MDAAARIFIDFSVRKLVLLTERIESCLDRLNEEQVGRAAAKMRTPSATWRCIFVATSGSGSFPALAASPTRANATQNSPRAAERHFRI